MSIAAYTYGNQMGMYDLLEAHQLPNSHGIRRQQHSRCTSVQSLRVLDELPVELSEQAYIWQWEQGVDWDGTWRQEWMRSGWRPGAGEEQSGTVD